MNAETITIGRKIISHIHPIISSLLESSSHIVIITDKTVEKLYLHQLKNSISHSNKKSITIRSGEKSKSRKMKAYIETKMLESNCNKETLIIALGGGVISDLAGFVAATYMRGIRYINIPTTLLAMVDSSIGGKVAINTPEGKNLIGAYWQPTKVIIDTQVLDTLPQTQFISGAIESFKMFLTCDEKALLKYENHLEELLSTKEDKIEWLIKMSIAIKSNIIQKDERENELRKILNFGHTVGHAIERASNYKILHGIAVGYGILIESKISFLLGLLAEDKYQKIKSILLKMHLKINKLKKFNIEDLLRHMKKDKKNQDEKIHYVLLNGIGSISKMNQKVAHAIDSEIVKQAIQLVLAEK